MERWGSAATLLSLAGGVLLLGAFVAVQAARRAPLMRLSIFRTPNIAAANLAQLLLGAAWIPMWFFLNLYLQQVLGYGAFEGGAALLPMTIAIMVLMVAIAPRVIARFGPKAPIVQVGSALGLAVMTALATSHGADRLGDAVALTDGYSAAFLGAAGIAVAGALLAAALLRVPRPPRTAGAASRDDSTVAA